MDLDRRYTLAGIEHQHDGAVAIAAAAPLGALVPVESPPALHVPEGLSGLVGRARKPIRIVPTRLRPRLTIGLLMACTGVYLYDTVLLLTNLR
jgi:hypothetical protein